MFHELCFQRLTSPTLCPSKRMFYGLDRNRQMPCSRFPPEISDCIIDLLHEEREVLKQCCLVSKSWVSRTRKHLFSSVEFSCSAGIDMWKKAFPDPANSPAHYTRSLSFACVEGVTTTADAEEASWIRAFSKVAQLKVWNGTRVNMRFCCHQCLIYSILPS